MTVNGDLERANELARQVEQLEQALATRALIGQAVGVMVATFHVDPSLAWTVLVGRSMEQNVKVRDLADCIVSAGVRGDRAELLRMVGAKVASHADSSSA